MRRIGTSELEVGPLCLGTNVFGWTVDEAGAFALLDAFVERGGNFIDTADAYAQSRPGNAGGESETTIGRWLTSRKNREAVVIATKVGEYRERPGLSAANIHRALEDSLRRLQVDAVDLYYAHRPDPATPIEESLGAFDELVTAGKVRYVGASNFPVELLDESLKVADREGYARVVALQPRYNLAHRGEYEGPLADLCRREEISCVAHSSLASGFLTGKYRPDGPPVESARNDRVSRVVATLPDGGAGLLSALDQVADAHASTPAQVALAWLVAQPTVAAPIASARTPEQLAELSAFAELSLSEEDLARLDRATAPARG